MYSFKFAEWGNHVIVSMWANELFFKEVAFIFEVYSGDPKISIPSPSVMSIAALNAMLDELSIWLDAKAANDPPRTKD